jgi:hypothetical protein
MALRLAGTSSSSGGQWSSQIFAKRRADFDVYRYRA